MQRPPEHETTRALARRSRGPQVATERPYLIGVRGEHAGRFFPLEGLTEVLLGRASDCAVAIMLDENVSRRQSRVAFDAEGNASICDLESLNGTLLNGTPVTHPAQLRRGDRIYVGDGTIFKFDYFSDEERSSFQAASLDALTECYNRGFLEARIQEMFHLARARAISLSVIFIDVDHFKQINDTSGHQAGDYALQQMADVVMRHLEANAVDASCYRYGGEEFVVLLPACGDEGCRRVAEGLRADVAATRLEFEGTQIAMTISLGTATLFPTQYESATALIGAADTNCLRAKREGRNRVVS